MSDEGEVTPRREPVDGGAIQQEVFDEAGRIRIVFEKVRLSIEGHPYLVVTCVGLLVLFGVDFGATRPEIGLSANQVLTLSVITIVATVTVMMYFLHVRRRK